MLSDAKTTAVLPEESGLDFQFESIFTFPRWRNARRSEGDDELQATGGPPLLPDRDLERLRDDRLLHPLRLLAQHGHRHRSLRSRRILSCLGNLGKLFASRRFLYAR